jgi:hypothetical protein
MEFDVGFLKVCEGGSMADNQTIIAEVLSLCSKLDDLVRAGNLNLEFPVSEESDARLGEIAENPRAAEYAIDSN